VRFILRAGNTIKRGQNQVIDILQQSGSESPPQLCDWSTLLVSFNVWSWSFLCFNETSRD